MADVGCEAVEEETCMNHFWIVSLVITKHKAGSIDIGNVVQVHADTSEAEAVGKTMRHVNECFPDYAIQITEVRLQVVNSASTVSTPVNKS